MKYQMNSLENILKKIDKMMNYLMSRLEELEIKQREIGITATEERERKLKEFIKSNPSGIY